MCVKYIPVEFGECCDPRDADLGPPGAWALGPVEPGGLPRALCGDPGGRLSATLISAAIGLLGPFCWLCPPGWPPLAPPIVCIDGGPSVGDPVVRPATNGDPAAGPLPFVMHCCAAAADAYPPGAHKGGDQ